MASTVGLSDIRGLPDPLQQYNWDIIIPIIPGVSGGERGLTIRALTASLPGMFLADTEVIIKGMTVRYAGQRQFNHDLEITFHETRDLYIRNTLLAWIQYARSVDGLTGTYKSQYSTVANMALYDDTGAQIRDIPMNGFYCKNVADATMDGTQPSGPVQISATFHYDFITN